ncbi:MAG TPA: flagellar type III secretion system pore protein FliP [Clostridiaceae bacterium]|jgi:flagellar biosynthetic protein FliP|nr:flagellar type III secretion system pore protein FliP [Clostridiaceae bacterium]
MKLKNLIKLLLILIVILLLCGCSAQNVPFPSINIEMQNAQNPDEVAASIQILLLLTVLSLAPSILIMMTSFSRIIIVLSFLRNALGTQQMPPNQVLIGLALFLSLFVMTPVFQDINENAYQPYINGEIAYEEALGNASDSIKEFMLGQIMDKKRDKDLAFFINLSGVETPAGMENLVKLPLSTIVPAFLISELTIAFKIGFLIYIPFLVVDMIIASTLMSMGMMMLPPILISLPFKILLFIVVDGWNLVVQALVGSFT